MNLLLLGPLESLGRYKGGVSYMSNFMCDVITSDFYDINIIKLNSYQKEMNVSSTGKIRFETLINYLLVKKEIRRLNKSEKIDCAYVHSSVGFGLLKDLIYLKKIKSNKKIIQIHFSDINIVLTKNRFLRRKILSLLKKVPNKIVVLSQAFKEDLIKLGFKEEKIEVLLNCSTFEIDEKEFQPKKEIKNISFMGSLEDRKGIYELLEAFKEINDDKLRLNIYGTTLTSEDKKKIELFKEAKNINFKGVVSGKDKIEAFKNTDIFILPSKNEGLPLTLLEAMTAGNIIITTKVGSIPELINGEFVDFIDGSMESIISSLKKLKDLDSDQISKLSKLSRFASLKFSKKEYSLKLKEILEK